MQQDADGIPEPRRPIQATANVVEQVAMARDTFRQRLYCPALAERIEPGQFFMVRLPGTTDPLLGRPFALYDTYLDSEGRPAGLDFGYVAVGKLTRLMPYWQPGQEAEIWGPLGNGFPVPEARHLILVAGGIGQTPFLAVAREALGLRRYGDPPRTVPSHPEHVTLCYGVRSKDNLAGLDDFDLPGLEVRLATDDGSRGHHGFVTDLLDSSIQSDDPPDAIYCCGPEPMMQIAAGVAQKNRIPCWLSLETPMACGVGACFSCVTKVRTTDDDWDYQRTCVAGPVFPADRLVF